MSQKAKALAKKIEKKGAPAIIEKQGEPIYDEVTRKQSAQSTPYPVHVVVDSTSLVSLGEIFGPDMVRSGDLIMTMHNCYSFEPDQGDVVVLSGVRYNIITRRPIYYKKGEIVLWRTLCRYGMRNDARAHGE